MKSNKYQKFMLPLFQEVIDKRVDKRINELLYSHDRDFRFQEIPDIEAEEEMSDFILRKKGEGITRLSTLDFVLNLKIPADQVERVIEDFEKEERVKEIDG